MTKNRVTHILFIILAVSAFLPMLQEHLNIPKMKPLAGVTQEVAFPKLTFSGFRNGSFQRQTENYIKQHFGYRPIVVRLYNQYLWDAYKKTYNKGNLSFGKEGWIYEPWFVEDYYHGGTYNQNKDSLALANRFDEEAFRLYQLQHILEQYGTTLVVCQTPGKDMVYPEYLPDDTVTTRPKKIAARDAYEERFNTLGINHINMEQWFLQLKDTVDFLLFPQKGTHWSNIAALYAADSLFRYIEAQKGVALNQLVIGKPTVDKFRKPDYDLEEMLNLMRPLKKLPQHYAEVDIVPKRNAVKPKMIVVGDSYYWNICRQIPMDSMFSSSPYWYYNSTVYFDSLHETTGTVDLVKELIDTDVVLLIYSSTQLYKMSNGFSQKALMALCCDTCDLREAEERCIRQIKNTPRWMDDIRRRAELYQLPVDEFIAGEAKNNVEQHPRWYLPALQDSVPSRRSERVTEYLTLKKHRDGIQ